MNDKRYTYDAQKENAIFARKLRGLFEEQGVTQKKLADFITQKTGESITRQSVGQWCSGNTCPSLKTIPVIANFFGVSTDYLLTDTLVQNPEADVISVCEYTGLTEKAVCFLNKLQSQASGESIASEFTIGFTTENYLKKLRKELDEFVEKHPKIATSINKYLQCKRNRDFKGADDIISNYENNKEYKEAFEKARALWHYESMIEDHKKSSVMKSKLSLMAISELFSASECESFVTNLTLLFSNFEKNFKKREIKIDSVADVCDFCEQTIKLPNKIIETILLNEIQAYIKGIKEDIYKRDDEIQAFYSFGEEKFNKQEGADDNG